MSGPASGLPAQHVSLQFERGTHDSGLSSAEFPQPYVMLSPSESSRSGRPATEHAVTSSAAK